MLRRCLIACAVLISLTSSAAAQKLVFFAGIVVDSAKRPLSNAEVSLPGIGLSRTTDDRGVFRMDNVPAGIHRVRARHIGHGQVDTTLTFRDEHNPEWRVTLGRIVTLDSVIVTAPLEPWQEEFEANRKRGFGRFLTRDDLAKVDGVSLPNVMRSVQGTDIIQTTGGQAYITSKRGPITGCQIPRLTGSRQEALAQRENTDECLRREKLYYVPDQGELQQGIRRACYPQVYVDGQLMNPGRPTAPFDVTAFATEQIQAIEWFQSESQTPSKYSVNNARCGVLVLHVRKKK